MSIAAESYPFAPYRELSNEILCERIRDAKRQLGSSLLILGHHYQQDEVIEHADLKGDSYQLSKLAAENADCRYIVFCGVHFMAETADILANRPESVASRNGERVRVVLPDMAAGCSMADMAAIRQLNRPGNCLLYTSRQTVRTIWQLNSIRNCSPPPIARELAGGRRQVTRFLQIAQ